MSSLSGLGSLVQDIAEEGNSQTHDSTYEANNSKLKVQGLPLILKAEHFILLPGLLVECGKKWKIVRKILPNSAGNSAEKSEIVRENAK